MLLTFATPDDVFAEYATVLAWGALIVVVTIIVLGAANKGTKSEVRPSTAIKIGCFAFLLLAIVSYTELYGSFIEAEISGDGARLTFAGPFYDPVVIKRERIGDVLVDYPGKGQPHSCYIKFVTDTGDSYRSATKEGTACNEYRAQIHALMNP